jgi:hypothetical protein
MSSREDAYARHQQARWLRPDAARWVRPDAARYLAPNADVGAIFPALDRKYSPDQPRVPAGYPDGGQWTDGSLSGSLSGDLGLFQIKPRERRRDGVHLAGELPTGDSPDQPSTEPPPIPPTKPKRSADRTKFLRAAANWLKGVSKLRTDIFTGAMNNVEWLKDYHNLIHAARDEPKSYEELQDGVGKRRPGYDDHHMVEQTWAEYFGFVRSQIDDPSNLVSIPRLQHYQITGWYAARNERFGGLSPRQYLSDKSWDERMRVGREALVLFKVLKP